MSRGLHREEEVGGELVGHSTDETPTRSIYREWKRLMQNGAGPARSAALTAGVSHG
jgi:hypothetical protein